jgi:hypothetical protein
VAQKDWGKTQSDYQDALGASATAPGNGYDRAGARSSGAPDYTDPTNIGGSGSTDSGWADQDDAG